MTHRTARTPAGTPTGPTSAGASVSQRVPRGTPAGGQFAATSHPESPVLLATADTAGRCPICRGVGGLDGTVTPCPGCTGTGEIADDNGWDRVARIERDCTITCLDCHGDGHGFEDGTRCRTCDGAGSITDYSLAE